MANGKDGDLRVALEAERLKLSRDIRGQAAELTVGENVHELFDVLQGISDRDAAVDRIQRLSEKLTQVEASLLALAEGRYGLCAECEEPISAKRLAVLPWATLCVRCQTQLEQRDGADYRSSSALFTD